MDQTSGPKVHQIEPTSDQLKVRERLFASEAAADALCVLTIGPYLIVTTHFDGGQTMAYLALVLTAAVIVIVGSYFSVAYLTRPIRRFVDDEARPGGASVEVTDDARVASLNLPILFTINIFVRYELGATAVGLSMLLSGALPFDRTIELLFRGLIGMLVPTVFMFFICERTLQPIRQYMALRCRGLRGLRDDRIIRIGVQARLLVVVVLMVSLPLFVLSTLFYQVRADASTPQQLDTWLITAVVLAFSLVIGGAVALLLAQSIAEPLARAGRIMREIGAGNLRLRVDVLTSDETGTLAERFNQMVDQLEESQNQLREANRQILELNHDLERKVAERTRELREVATRNRVILESIGDGVIVFDAGQRATMANPAVREVLGLAPAQVLGHRVDSIVGSDATPEDRDRSLAILTGMLAARGNAQKASPVMLKFRLGGRIISTSFAPIESQDGDLNGGMVAVFRDTTEVEQLATDLARTNEDLILANRHKSEFLANMSHELRTPLNAIIGFSELLREESFGPLNARQTRYVGNIYASGEHLLRLINDILDLSKVEAGRLQLDRKLFAVGPILKDVQTMMKPLADRKGLALELSIDRGVETVYADEGKFRQVVLNLLSNAVKFTDEGQVTIRASRTGRVLRVSVQDTGVGIKAEDLGRLFQEFQQLDGSSTRRHEGTGLGLALSKRLVELQGGEMQVTSAFGEGSTFSFTLPTTPAALAPGGAAEPTNESTELGQPASDNLILLVEDSQDAADLLTFYLTEGGYSVARATTGEEALTLARQLKPAAILLDILLPTIDGWTVLRELKSDPETSATPVVVVSAVDSRGLGLSLGAVDYLNKPVSKSELLGRIARLGLTKAESKEPVLVVDDDPLVVDLLATTLSAEGYGVLKAYGGRDGIRLATKHHPKLLVLDLILPDVTGIEVVHDLKAERSTSEMPIFIFTAKDLSPEERAFLNGRIEGLARKGRFERETFLEEVRRITGRANKGCGDRPGESGSPAGRADELSAVGGTQGEGR